MHRSVKLPLSTSFSSTATGFHCTTPWVTRMLSRMGQRAAHCASLLVRRRSDQFDASRIAPNTRAGLIIHSSHHPNITSSRNPSTLSFGSDISWHWRASFLLCCAISPVSPGCVSRKIFVCGVWCVLLLALLRSQRFLNREAMVLLLLDLFLSSLSRVQAGRLDAHFLYGVIAIGVVYQEVIF